MLSSSSKSESQSPDKVTTVNARPNDRDIDEGQEKEGTIIDIDNGGPSDEDDSFQLYDLRVEVVCPPLVPDVDGGGQKRILCGAREGDFFTLEGEMLHFPDGQGMSIYSLAAVLPLLPAKQRPGLHKNDWMTTDAIVACPDPNCPSQLKIIRTGLRTFKHGEVTVVPLR